MVQKQNVFGLRSSDVAKRRAWLARLRWGTVAILATILVLDLAFPLPLPKARDTSTLVVARDGTPLRAFADSNGVWRYPATMESVSPLYLQALLNYEDRWFWKHPGVNPWALLRAGGQWLRGGRIVSGGSTLTMQVARILDRTRVRRGGRPSNYYARCSWKRIYPSGRSCGCTSSARRSAEPSRAWKRPAGPTSASRHHACRRPRRRCWRCFRNRPADCVPTAIPRPHERRATRCSTHGRARCVDPGAGGRRRHRTGGGPFAEAAAERRPAGRTPAPGRSQSDASFPASTRDCSAAGGTRFRLFLQPSGTYFRCLAGGRQRHLQARPMSVR